MSENKKPTGGNGQSGFRMSPRAWVGLAIAIVSIAFIIQNRQEVEINLLLFTVSAPLYIVLSAVFLAGALTLWLIARRRR